MLVVFLWCFIAIIVASLYVISLQGLRRLQLVDQRNRPIALFAWARMMIVLGLFVSMMLYLSLVHFILVAGVFVVTVWTLLWWLTYKHDE